MNDNSFPAHDTARPEFPSDPFEHALNVLRSNGLDFEVVGDFDGIAAGPGSYERAA